MFSLTAKRIMVSGAMVLAWGIAQAHACSDDQSPAVDARATDPKITEVVGALHADQVEAILSKLVSFGNRNTLSSMTPDLAPGTGITPAATWIEGQFREISAACGGCLEIHRDEFTEQPPAVVTKLTRIPTATRLVNVYAVLRGADPAQRGRMYLVTGHYDSRASDTLDTHTPAPGANDDGSGVAVSLLCARALTKLRPAATIVFAAVAGEEQGLNGSHHLAAMAEAEGWDLEGVLNNDIVGGDTTPGDTGQRKDTVRVFSEGIPATATPVEVARIEQLGYESDSPSRELARAIAQVSAAYFGTASSGAAQFGDQAGQQGGSTPAAAFHPTLIFRSDRFLRGGDHTSFNKSGFPAVRFTEWRENFNHQHQDPRTANGVEYGDLLKFVDPNYVVHVARLNAYTLATLAMAPPPPREVQLVTRELDNNSTLNWQPGPGAPAGTSYRVVWRATDAGQWQSSQAVAAGATTATIPVSKDNVIFGVQAVDAAGHFSVAVPPLPAR